MTDEQLPYVKTFMARIVNEKIPWPKKSSVSREFKAWVDGLSKDELEVYLDRLRMLTKALSDHETSEQKPEKTGSFILFASYPPSEAAIREQISKIGGEATAYYSLALWRTLQYEEQLQGLNASREKS
jgi:hypothetical protein